MARSWRLFLEYPSMRGESLIEFGAVVGDDDGSPVGLFFRPPRQEFAQPRG